MRFIHLLPVVALAVASALYAQKPAVPAEPTTPPARTFHDPRFGISFQVPTGWELNRKDHEVSTFSLDARSSVKATQLRAVADISFNPYPQSTFSGAYFYASVTPHVSEADCNRQASSKNARPVSTAKVAGIAFAHGYDEHGGVCVESRDEVYTAEHNGSCYRFDLVINNFCGGDVSGVRDISDKQLDSVRKRLEAILSSVQLDQ